MSTSRRSDCPVSFALDAIGDKWSLLILRDILLFGKRRFAELHQSDERIASNILTNRLHRMEEQGILARQKDPADGRRFIYRATDKGLDLIPVILELGAWGARYDDKTGAPAGAADDYYNNRDRRISEARGKAAM